MTSVTVGGDTAAVERTYTYVSMENGDIVFDTPLTVGNVSFSGLTWDGENNSYDLLKSSSGEYRLKQGTVPLVALDKLYGIGKPFTRLRYFNDTALWNALGAAEGTSNPIYTGIWDRIDLIIIFYTRGGLARFDELFTGGHFNYVDVYFGYSDEGEGYKIVLDVNITLSGSNFSIPYSFPVTFDAEDPSLFTFGSTPSYDANGAVFYEDGQIPAALGGSITPTKTLVNAFAGKTFKMGWSTLKYKSEILGELRSVGTGTQSVYVGGITE
jgi:hypothetical protein